MTDASSPSGSSTRSPSPARTTTTASATQTLDLLGVDLPPDDADALLIAALLLQDIAEHDGSRKGKGRHDAPLTDEDLAFSLFHSEAEGVVSVLQDALVARSLDNAVATDRDLLQAIHLMEVQAAQDRAYAEALSQGEALPVPMQPRVDESVFGSPQEVFQFVEPTLKDMGVSDLLAGVHSMAVSDDYVERVMGATAKKGESSRSALECTICGDRIRGQVITMPCNHPYDIKCARDLFETCTRDEGLFPPRCCRQEIALNLVAPYLNAALIKLFEAKTQEFTTINRLYCANAACSHFLGPASDEPTGVDCSSCGQQTCGSCKSAAHPTHVPCATDEAAQQLLVVAREAGWQQCPSCHRMIELSLGCYHMTCLCAFHFCYLCTAEWKTCACRGWDEERLLQEAQQRVEREQQYENRVVPPAQVHQAVEMAADYLRYNHECDHDRWRYRHGGGDCETCGDYLPMFLMRCTDCQMLACKRCQRNRL